MYILGKGERGKGKGEGWLKVGLLLCLGAIAVTTVSSTSKVQVCYQQATEGYSRSYGWNIA